MCKNNLEVKKKNKWKKFYTWNFLPKVALIKILIW